MNQARSLLFKIITRTALVASLALGILLIPNAAVFDESLSPAISKILSHSANSAIVGNAAAMSYGLAAASDRDIETVGQRLVALLHEKRNQLEPANLTPEENTQLLGGHDLDSTWQLLYPAAVKCNPRDQQRCFSALLPEIQSSPITHARLLVQLARYKHLTQQPHYIEDTRDLDASSPLPFYGLMLQLSRINNAVAYLQSGHTGLLEAAQQDMRFWRIALQESQTLVGKMVALNALRGNLFALSEAIKTQTQLTEAETQLLHKLLTPLTAEEISISEALTAELRLVVQDRKEFFSYMAAGNEHNRWFLVPLMQPTASVNLYYRQTYQPAYTLSQMSAIDFYARAQQPVKAETFTIINPYNLGGKIALSNTWQLAPYIGRAHDLAGLYLLLNLQVELKRTAPQDLATAIKASLFKNPYTEKPFNYNATTQLLGFPCFDFKDNCHLQL